MIILLYIGIFLLSYLLGSFPTAYLVVKFFTKKDIRQEGTGNVGAMNTARATGKWYLFILVAFVDAMKAALAVYIAEKIDIPQFQVLGGVTVACFGVILGHCYSLYFKVKDGKFAGGKAIACLFGILCILNFFEFSLPWCVALLLPIILTGNLFLGQLTGTLALPLIAFFILPQYFPAAILMGIPIFIKQSPRIIPMLKGKEPKWYWKNKS